MARTVLILKRWWIIALMIPLALSLTSCAKPVSGASSPNYGYSFCSGTMGTFDIYVIPQASGMYQLSVIPVQLTSPGDIVQMTLANSGLGSRNLQTDVTLENDEEVNAGLLTDADLNTYTTVAITGFDSSGQPFVSQTSQTSAFCQLPMPGEDLSGGY